MGDSYGSLIRANANDGSRYFIGRGFDVTLDGVVIHDVHELNEEAGTVTVTARDKDGKRIIDGGNIRTEVKHGKVRVVGFSAPEREAIHKRQQGPDIDNATDEELLAELKRRGVA